MTALCTLTWFDSLEIHPGLQQDSLDAGIRLIKYLSKLKSSGACRKATWTVAEHESL